jgi:hypothetical protein
MPKTRPQIKVTVRVDIKVGPPGPGQGEKWSAFWRKLVTSVQENERSASVEPAQGEKKHDPNNQNPH